MTLATSRSAPNHASPFLRSDHRPSRQALVTNIHAWVSSAQMLVVLEVPPTATLPRVEHGGHGMQASPWLARLNRSRRAAILTLTTPQHYANKEVLS